MGDGQMDTSDDGVTESGEESHEEVAIANAIASATPAARAQRAAAHALRVEVCAAEHAFAPGGPGALAAQADFEMRAQDGEMDAVEKLDSDNVAAMPSEDEAMDNEPTSGAAPAPAQPPAPAPAPAPAPTAAHHPAAAAAPPRIPVADLNGAQVGALVRALGLEVVAERLVTDGVLGEDLAVMTEADLKEDHEVKVGNQRRKIVAAVAEYVAAGGVPSSLLATTAPPPPMPAAPAPASAFAAAAAGGAAGQAAVKAEAGGVVKAAAAAGEGGNAAALVALAGGIDTLQKYAEPHGVPGQPCKYAFLGFQVITANIKAWYKHTVTGKVVVLLTIHDAADPVNTRLTKANSKKRKTPLVAPQDGLLSLEQLKAA